MDESSKIQSLTCRAGKECGLVAIFFRPEVVWKKEKEGDEQRVNAVVVRPALHHGQVCE